MAFRRSNDGWGMIRSAALCLALALACASPGVAFSAAAQDAAAKPAQKPAASVKAAKPKTAKTKTAKPKAAAASPKPEQPRSLLNRMKMTTEVPDAADFVRGSRPGDLDYVPVRGSRNEPAIPVLTAEEIRAKEAELDAVRLRHDSSARRKPSAKATTSVADGRRGPPQRKPQPNCALTCEIKTIPEENRAGRL